MILNYIFKQSFRDLDGDGKVDGEGETINMTMKPVSHFNYEVIRNKKIFY